MSLLQSRTARRTSTGRRAMRLAATSDARRCPTARCSRASDRTNASAPIYSKIRWRRRPRIDPVCPLLSPSSNSSSSRNSSRSSRKSSRRNCTIRASLSCPYAPLCRAQSTRPRWMLRRRHWPATRMACVHCPPADIRPVNCAAWALCKDSTMIIH